MLLEEAKKNIVKDSTSDSGTSSQSTEDKKKSGYIQVKSRTGSTEDSVTQQSVPAAATSVTPQAAVLVGPNGRRLSKNGERTSTPPRKILPKADTSDVSGKQNVVSPIVTGQNIPTNQVCIKITYP